MARVQGNTVNACTIYTVERFSRSWTKDVRSRTKYVANGHLEITYKRAPFERENEAWEEAGNFCGAHFLWLVRLEHTLPVSTRSM